MRRAPGGSIGVHVGAEHVHAAWRGAGGQWHAADAPWDGTPAGLAAALDDIAAQAPAGVRAVVALARPLARTRAVDFPRMAAAALARVLERDWTRYVIPARDVPHAVAVARAGGGWCASFAPQDLLAAIDAAAEAHGWRECTVRTVEDALAANAHASGRLRGARYVVVACDDRGARWVVEARDGIVLIARAGAARSAEDVVAAAAGSDVVVLGAREPRSSMARALGALGVHTHVTAVDDVGALAPLPALLAAIAAGTPSRMPLRSARAHEAVQRTVRRLTAAMFAGAAALLVAAVAVDTARTDRELARVRTERAELAAPVRAALERRAAMEQGAELARAVAERERSASRTTEAIAAVALALPAEAVLSRLAVRGDTVLVEGTSTRGGAVYSALRSVAMLEGVRLSSPMRQERAAVAAPVDHFAFAARLRAGPVRR